ncbi:hypothetical protein LXL04_007591 [Taraxacum kok-saghyz]
MCYEDLYKKFQKNFRYLSPPEVGFSEKLKVCKKICTYEKFKKNRFFGIFFCDRACILAISSPPKSVFQKRDSSNENLSYCENNGGGAKVVASWWRPSDGGRRLSL